MNITKLPNLTVFADSDSGGKHTEDGKIRTACQCYVMISPL